MITNRYTISFLALLCLNIVLLSGCQISSLSAEAATDSPATISWMASETSIDKGSGVINVPQVLTDSGAPELQLRAPSMLDGSAHAQVLYDKAQGIIVVEARYEGLPYRPTFCYEYNPSNAYNQFPFPCVENGEWQIWVVLDMFNHTSDFIYDADTGVLIGHETDLPETMPENVVAIAYPSLQMVESPGFEPDPKTLIANVRFEYDYHQILDQNGTAGTKYAQVRTELCNPDSVIPYWTNGGSPVEEAMNFDDILGYIENGNKIMIALSYGPNPKPDYLLARDNIMIGWLGTGPEEESAWPVSTKLETYHQSGFVPTLPQPTFESVDCGA